MKVRWVAYFKRRTSLHPDQSRDLYLLTGPGLGDGYQYANVRTASRRVTPLWFNTKEEAEAAAAVAVSRLWSAPSFIPFAKPRRYRRPRR